MPRDMPTARFKLVSRINPVSWSKLLMLSGRGDISDSLGSDMDAPTVNGAPPSARFRVFDGKSDMTSGSRGGWEPLLGTSPGRSIPFDPARYDAAVLRERWADGVAQRFKNDPASSEVGIRLLEAKVARAAKAAQRARQFAEEKEQEAARAWETASEAEQAMRIRTALVTARSAPAHERAIRTLMAWNIQVDEAMFLGGLEKADFLREFEPDFFFDDQTGTCDTASRVSPTGHVVSGVKNEQP